MKKRILATLCLILVAVLMLDVFLPIGCGFAPTAQAGGKIKLNKSKISLNTGETYQLTLNGAKKKVKWSSSDKSIATVNSKGEVKAKKAGEATITAKSGGKKYRCKVTVKPILSVNKTKLTLGVNEKDTVKVTFKAKGTVYWEIDNSSVAECDWSGNWKGNKINLEVKALRPGTTTITITNSKTKDKVKIQVIVDLNNPQ